MTTADVTFFVNTYSWHSSLCMADKKGTRMAAQRQNGHSGA